LTDQRPLVEEIKAEQRCVWSHAAGGEIHLHDPKITSLIYREFLFRQSHRVPLNKRSVNNLLTNYTRLTPTESTLLKYNTCS